MQKLLRFYGKDIQSIDFEPWAEQKPKVLRPIARKWFRTIQTCGEGVEVIFHDNHPIACVEEAPFVYIDVFAQHINLGFFYGAHFINTQNIMEGTGKSMRHIKLRPDSPDHEVAIRHLIEVAYFDIKERLISAF